MVWKRAASMWRGMQRRLQGHLVGVAPGGECHMHHEGARGMRNAKAEPNCCCRAKELSGKGINPTT